MTGIASNTSADLNAFGQLPAGASRSGGFIQDRQQPACVGDGTSRCPVAGPNIHTVDSFPTGRRVYAYWPDGCHIDPDAGWYLTDTAFAPPAYGPGQHPGGRCFRAFVGDNIASFYSGRAPTHWAEQEDVNLLINTPIHFAAIRSIQKSINS